VGARGRKKKGDRGYGAIVQLIVGRQFCTGILKEGLECGKLKNLHC
jgi:hypothetical protein